MHSAMEENKKYDPAFDEEEEGIDIVALFKGLWDGRKIVLLCTAAFVVLGLVAALTMQRTYRVNTVMVPQLSSSRSSSLNSLASLAGFDLNSSASAELSPVTYPQIVNSVPFRLEMMHAPVHYAKVDTAISLLDYEREYAKLSLSQALKKYTVGLPRVILGAVRGKQPEVALPAEETAEGETKPLVVSREEYEMLDDIGRDISLAVDKKDGFLTLSVTGREPVQTAELALKAQQLLQDEITRFRTEKAQAELAYVQARYDEVKAESDRYQTQLALLRDRSQNMATTRSQIEMEQTSAKYNIASSIYREMAMELEQAKMQVKKDTPAFTILQPVAIPNKSANSRSRTLILWTLVGFVLGCGIALGKSVLDRRKESSAS